MSQTILKQKQPRKPRYRREKTRYFQLQERDIQIIKLIYKHRFLYSTHIAALVSGSGQGVLRRLQLLFHGGYLDRPREQIKPYQAGSNSMVYGLGNKGADLLAADFGVSRGKMDWTSKNREVKSVYLEHTLMVADFMVCLELACQRHGGVEIIELEEIKPNLALSWKVKTKREIKGKQKELSFGMAPDKIFGLHFVFDSPGKNKAYFFLEADRSTMPVKRSGFLKTSYFKKMIGYWASWREGLFQKNFGFKNARVLTITKSQERINSMIAACKEVDERGKGSKMFLFAQAQEFLLNNPNRILDRIWQNGRDEQLISLFD